ncbi:MAG: DNA starvation/stationary phase protection protein, partial [Anaerolineae bacterium]|nr:DNA starvation/stationary phase protection protein [Anaerolineae bacterium]
MSNKLHNKMNEYLANQQVMYIKLHNLHWYVQGRGFFTLHAKLEELYDQTAEILDAVAERILALGGAPVASMKKALAMTAVKELDDAPIAAKDVLKILVIDTEWWIKDTEAIIKMAEEAGDVGTADLFTGYLAEYQ